MTSPAICIPSNVLTPSCFRDANLFRESYKTIGTDRCRDYITGYNGIIGWAAPNNNADRNNHENVNVLKSTGTGRALKRKGRISAHDQAFLDSVHAYRDPLLSNPRRKNPVLQNIVVTVDYGTRINLSDIVGEKAYASYNSSTFAAAIVKMMPSKGTILAFRSGVCVNVGTRGIESARLLSHRFRQQLEGLGYQPTIRKFMIRNMVVSTNIGFGINLSKINVAHSEICTYDPESFPALKMEMNNPTGGILVFDNGNCIMMGFQDVRLTYPDFNRIFPILYAARDNTAPKNSQARQKHRIEQHEMEKNLMRKLRMQQSTLIDTGGEVKDENTIILEEMLACVEKNSKAKKTVVLPTLKLRNKRSRETESTNGTEEGHVPAIVEATRNKRRRTATTPSNDNNLVYVHANSNNSNGRQHV